MGINGVIRGSEYLSSTPGTTCCIRPLLGDLTLIQNRNDCP